MLIFGISWKYTIMAMDTDNGKDSSLKKSLYIFQSITGKSKWALAFLLADC